MPPTIRLIVSVPEATPAFVRSTAFIAAVLIGDITRPSPRPIRMNAGSSSPYVVATVIRDCRYIDTATISSPAVISGRGPMRSDRRPATGPAMMMITVEGRKRTPVSSGLKPRMFCM